VELSTLKDSRWSDCGIAWIAGCPASRNPQILARDRDSLVSEILLHWAAEEQPEFLLNQLKES